MIANSLDVQLHPLGALSKPALILKMRPEMDAKCVSHPHSHACMLFKMLVYYISKFWVQSLQCTSSFVLETLDTIAFATLGILAIIGEDSNLKLYNALLTLNAFVSISESNPESTDFGLVPPPMKKFCSCRNKMSYRTIN